MNKIYKNLLPILILWLTSSALLAQGIRGKITDAANGTTLPGVSILVPGTSTGTASGANGEYFLKLSKGTYQVKVSFIGYETITTTVVVGAATVTKDFSLKVSGSALNEVVVTGSRSAIPRTNIETPVPVDVISAKEMRSFAQTDVTQILNYVAPSFSSNRQTVTDGTDHIDPASLRGLGPDQVLVLVNGKRRHSSALVNINGSVGRGSVGTDLNAIPVAAIDHIEVLRDGASAQYGSDAIGGVINIVLKKNTPLNISTLYGQSNSHALGRTFNDGKTFELDASKGFDLNGKGFVNLAGQYQDRGATNRTGTDTRPLLYNGNSGGVISRMTGETDAAFATRYATVKANDDAKAAAAGFDRNDMVVGNSAMKNYGFFGNGQYAISNHADIYLATGFNYKTGLSSGNYRIPGAATQIDLGYYPNGFLPHITTDIYDISISGGVKGKFGEWNYDLSNTFGRNSLRFGVTNSLNASLPLGTSPRSFYAGTQAFNQNTSNLDVSRKYKFDGILTSLNTAYGAELRIEDFQIKAGDELSYSFGQPSAGIAGRYITPTTAASAGAQVFPGFQPSNVTNSTRNSAAVYADLEAEFGPRVLVEAAGRYEHFSDFGSNFSYKLTSRVKLVDDISIRGALATGFRAPSLAQFYFNNVSTQFTNGVPLQVLTVNNQSDVVRQFGVGGLKPETSMSYSLGLAGKVLKTFTFTIDAYQIDIKDRIVLSSQFSRSNAAVAAILDPVDPLKQIGAVQFFTNAIGTTTRGLDVVLSDRIGLGATSSVTLAAAANFNKTQVTSVQTSDVIGSSAALTTILFNRQERARFEGAIPKSKINLSATFNVNRFNASLRTVRFGETFAYYTTVDAIRDQVFTAKWVTDATVGYKLIKQLDLSVGVNNLFDIYPDKLNIDPNNSSTNTTTFSANDNTNFGRFRYPTTSQQFGFNGRFLFAKLTYTL
ncbi:MAG: TonB-dependent receptor [Sphingobacteriaceae bacterium]|nr:MAG: TonB-dependent receptor [Sphingobacteriaceae bacterium]